MATQTAAFALLGGTLLFALGAASIACACRLCVATDYASAILTLLGAVTGGLVGFLWLDGRIGRYFLGVLWLIVLVAPLVGILAASSRRKAGTATAGWVLAFAAVFALRLPLAVPLGTAALIGLTIEVLAVTFTAFPAFIVGALLGTHPVTRKHLPRLDRE
ncbi:MAG: hypothetical protein ACI8UR_001330 [Natronomonas sp.]|jgi:hypothetical protein|uniref:hypothetical protein n=1 Tax=Natronomonas sp. TaxID=2184060 RepID=UPI003989811D